MHLYRDPGHPGWRLRGPDLDIASRQSLWKIELERLEILSRAIERMYQLSIGAILADRLLRRGVDREDRARDHQPGVKLRRDSHCGPR